MKRIMILALALVLVFSLALTGCQKPCEHEWEAADCDDPKTCELCDATEGAPLGHTWKAATCNAAKTCETCGEVEGKALGHSWVEATCEKPKTCSGCKAEEGEALGHTWVEATTETPKTCTTCGKTEGDPINVDDRFVTSKCQEVFGTWSGSYQQSYESMGLDPSIKLSFNVTMTFTNDGNMTLVMAANPDTYKDEMFAFTKALTLLSLSQQGISPDQADAAMQAEYGMTLDAYIESSLAEIDPDDQSYEESMVYYVDNGKIYAASDWDEELTPSTYSIDGDTMHMVDGEMELTMTKVKD